MKTKVYIFVILLVSITWCHCNETENEKSSRILSRRRRYLTFPEGASFQLVYDQIIPIVDYTNLFIFGVTTALAWPLPSEPISFAKLREMYENTTLPDIRRQDEHDDIDNEIATDELSKTNLVFNQNDAYYTNNRYYSRPLAQKSGSTKLNPIYGGKDLYYKNRNRSGLGSSAKGNNLNTRMSNQIDRIAKRPFKPWQNAASWAHTNLVQSPPARQAARHRVYPVLGKRSVRDLNVHHQDHEEDRLALHHHRSTRHSLYESIERYLEAHKHHGNECVRKALCETAQRRKRDTQPGTFIVELMRVIFSLPDLEGELVDNGNFDRVRREYDEAFHGHSKDCVKKFPACSVSIWNSWYTQ